MFNSHALHGMDIYLMDSHSLGWGSVDWIHAVWGGCNGHTLGDSGDLIHRYTLGGTVLWIHAI